MWGGFAFGSRLEEFGFRFTSNYDIRTHISAIRDRSINNYEVNSSSQNKCCIKECDRTPLYILQWNGPYERYVCGDDAHLVTAAFHTDYKPDELEKIVDHTEQSIDYPEFIEPLKERIKELNQK